MKQSISEGFTLDVLQNYTTYRLDLDNDFLRCLDVSPLCDE
jgi:hypothetical protein